MRVLPRKQATFEFFLFQVEQVIMYCKKYLSPAARRVHHGTLSVYLYGGNQTFGKWHCTVQKSPLLKNQNSGSKTFDSDLAFLTDERLNNSSNVIRLDHPSKLIYVCGVSHHSHLSTVRVDSLLRDLWPDRIVIELCEHRLNQIRLEMALQSPLQNNIRFALHRLFRYSLSMRHAHGPFIATLRYADSHKVPILCGDMSSTEIKRKLKETLEQIQNGSHSSCNNQDEGSNVLSTIMRRLVPNRNVDERLLDRERGSSNRGREASREDARRIVSECSPAVYSILHEERERLITQKIIECKEDVVVAIVGIGHLDGIERYWKGKHHL